MHGVCPLRFEHEILRPAARRSGWEMSVSGPGTAGIERWAKAIRLPSGSRVVLAGVAGGLSVHAKPGTAAAASEVIDTAGHRWTPTATLPGRTLRCLSVDAPLRTPDAKRAAATQHGADMVDMESAAFARVATERGWDWAVVRGVSDGPGDTLPPGIEHWTDAAGATRPLVMAAAVLRHPELLLTLPALGKRSTAAMRAVESVLRAPHGRA